jgi:hypothetical protein
MPRDVEKFVETKIPFRLSMTEFVDIGRRRRMAQALRYWDEKVGDTNLETVSAQYEGEEFVVRFRWKEGTGVDGKIEEAFGG